MPQQFGLPYWFTLSTSREKLELLENFNMLDTRTKPQIILAWFLWHKAKNWDMVTGSSWTTVRVLFQCRGLHSGTWLTTWSGSCNGGKNERQFRQVQWFRVLFWPVSVQFVLKLTFFDRFTTSLYQHLHVLFHTHLACRNLFSLVRSHGCWGWAPGTLFPNTYH